jgi:DNA gyrase/topoisomerase IV subunit A
METIQQLKQDKSKLIDEILSLVHVIDQKNEYIDHLKTKLSLKEMKFEDKDLDQIFERND